MVLSGMDDGESGGEETLLTDLTPSLCAADNVSALLRRGYYVPVWATVLDSVRCAL